MAARPRAGGACTRSTRRAGIRHYRHVADLESHGRASHVTDVSNASRTLLLDLHSLAWSDGLFELFNVPRAVLPRVTASSGLMGTTVPQLFGEAIAIGGNAGDQQAATFGQACFGVGMAKNTIGTGAFMLMNVGARPRHRKTGCRQL